MKRKITYLITSFIIAAGIISACKKNTDDPAPSASYGTLMIHLHTNVDTNEVDDYGTVYNTAAHRKISVNKAQLYITNIKLIKLDGSTVSAPHTIIYKIQETEPYLVGQVPTGNYKSVSFNVGLSPATNLMTPLASDTILNQPSMWFGSTAQPDGFVFVNFQGSIDTTTNATGTTGQMQPFKYLIGTNANYKNVIMPNKNYTITTGQTQYIHMIIDYNKLLNGITLNNPANLMVTTPADNSSTLATTIRNNIASMFTYEY